MHKSRLCALVLDTDTADIDGAARFWAAALGRELRPADAEHPTYRSLGRHPNDPIVLVQQALKRGSPPQARPVRPRAAGARPRRVHRLDDR